MTTYKQALAELAYQHHREDVAAALNSEQMRIAASVFNEVDDEFYKDPRVDFGTFDNCREWGLTVTAGGWTFCAYEHRNSDEINLEGCPTAEAETWGPYGGADKFDTLASYPWRDYNRAAQALNYLLACALEAHEAAQDGGAPFTRQRAIAALKATSAGRGRR